MITRLRSLYPDFEILIMDDNSKDGSKALVESLKDPKVTFFTRDPEDRGLSASICQGIVETKTDLFINMDCDFQHPPEVLADIYSKLTCGADLVVGVRSDRKSGLSFVRWVGSWGCHYMAVLTLKFRGKTSSHDIMSGLFGGKTNLFRTVIQENIQDFEIRGFKTLFDLMKFAPGKLKLSEVTYDFGTRDGGESKLSSGVILSFLRQCGPVGRFMAKVGSIFTKK